MSPNREDNSATGAVAGRMEYQTSQPGDSWGQPPASQYAFYVDNAMVLHGHLLAGGMYCAEPSSAQLAVDPDLLVEFAAWESASDEAVQGM